MKLDLSLIVPCYNEAPHLAASIRDVIDVLELTPWSWEIVFVDDASRDDTRDVIRRLAADEPRCRYIFHPSNRGRGAAFKTGFTNSRGAVVGFVDIDLEVHARYIPSLVNEIRHGGADIATGKRYYSLRQTGGLPRAAMSWIYRRLCDVLLSLDVEDTETGCKFFKRDTTAELVMGSVADGWFWDTEVIARACLANLRIREVPVLFLRRHDKTSTVHLWRDSWAHLRELRRFRGTIGLSRRAKSPVYWTGYGYDLVMRALYGDQYEATYAAVAAHIPDGASVVDLCCGTAHLHRNYLRQRGCAYVGLDANGDFILHAQRHGVDARWFNVITDPIPSADYVVMCSSLYHFGDHAGEVIERMRTAARCAVIISEPVRNLADAPVIGGLAASLTNPGVGSFEKRFDLASFTELARRHGAEPIHAGDERNAIAILSPLAEVASAQSA